MVEIEQLPEGGYRVSRVFATKAAMQAGASALERVVPEAYEPLPVPASRVGWFEGQAVGGRVDNGPASPIEPRLNGIRDDVPTIGMRD